MSVCRICNQPIVRAPGTPGREPTVCPGTSTYTGKGKRRRRHRKLSECERKAQASKTLRRLVASLDPETIPECDHEKVAKDMNAARMRLVRSKKAT